MTLDNPEEYTRQELDVYLEYFYDGDASIGTGGTAHDATDYVAFVATDDDGLYAELQGAGFHAVVPEDGDGTRFYVFPREEPLMHSFADRADEKEEADA